MKHLFVPYELALKLKEKGFDEPCIGGWLRHPITDEMDIMITHLNNPLTLENWHSLENTLAPLYQQVIDWFREKYNIDIFINAHYKTDNSIAGYLFDVYDRREKYDTHKGCFESPDYYEALNKAVEEAIKLI